MEEVVQNNESRPNNKPQDQKNGNRKIVIGYKEEKIWCCMVMSGGRQTGGLTK